MEEKGIEFSSNPIGFFTQLFRSSITIEREYHGLGVASQKLSFSKSALQLLQQHLPESAWKYLHHFFLSDCALKGKQHMEDRFTSEMVQKHKDYCAFLAYYYLQYPLQSVYNYDDLSQAPWVVHEPQVQDVGSTYPITNGYIADDKRGNGNLRRKIRLGEIVSLEEVSANEMSRSNKRVRREVDDDVADTTSKLQVYNF